MLAGETYNVFIKCIGPQGVTSEREIYKKGKKALYKNA